jgi:hypothetical protein
VTPPFFSRAGAARIVVAGSLATLVVIALVVVLVAQRNPARLVILLPLQGTSVVCFAAVAAPFLLGLVAMLVVRRRREAALAWGTITGCVILATACATPVIEIAVEEQRDRRIAVVAVAPDGALEVALAIRHGDSGDFLILRARSRDGLASRYARFPLAFLCNSHPTEVTFTSPVDVRVRTNGEFGGTVRLEPTTLEPDRRLDDCGDDQG